MVLFYLDERTELQQLIQVDLLPYRGQLLSVTQVALTEQWLSKAQVRQ